MRIIALFNLKPGVSREEYEEWAKHRDLPSVRSLVSVKDFWVYRTTGLLFSEERPPFDYVEVIDITRMEEFERDLAGDIVQGLAAEMARFTDGASFMTTESLQP